MTQTSDWENEIDEYIKEISDLKFSAKLQFRNFMTALEMDNISLGKLSDMKKQFIWCGSSRLLHPWKLSRRT